jgi:hypothetical protein
MSRDEPNELAPGVAARADKTDEKGFRYFSRPTIANCPS